MFVHIAFSCSLLFFFFFKQKTAYEMRISDWSSDVCSSDLVWALGLDTCTAWFAFFRHAPGFEGLTLKRPANSPESEKMHNDDYHLPGGNGDVARLIIRSMIPDALPTGDVFDVADKRMDYADRKGTRLNSSHYCASRLQYSDCIT